MRAYVLCCLLGAASAFRTGWRPSTGLARLQTARERSALRMVETVDVCMPALSSTMTEGKIVQWLKSVGDKVEAGDSLMVVESDKADMDVEAFDAGYLAKIITPEGESAGVGSAVAVLVNSVDDVGKVGEGGGGAAPAASAPAPPVAAEATSDPPAAPAGGGAPAVELTMPALSSTMTEGKIVQWLKGVGDKVEVGDPVMVVESDKADMDVEAFEEGYIATILTEEGGSAAVGATVALLAASESEIAAVAAGGGGGSAAAASAPAPSPAAEAAPAVASTPASGGEGAVVNSGRVVASGYAKKTASEMGIDLRVVPGSGPGGRIVAKDVTTAAAGGAYTHTPAPGVIAATPMAKQLAKSKGLDLSTVKGTGNFGRVTEDDVLLALGMPPKKQSAAPPAPAPAPAAAVPTSGSASTEPVAPVAVTSPAPAPTPGPSGVQPMNGMQKAVVKNMEASMTAPIFRVSRTIVTDKFDELYKTIKPKGVTVSALLAKAVAICLEKHPIINAVYDPSGAIKFNENINVAMAVALDGGLITPTLQQANEKDIYSLGREWKELVSKAKQKRLAPDEYSSGTFTISNLGMFGVSSFEAILPPGTGSILSIGGSTPTVVPQANGHFGVVKQMTVTITCDHRHIYGADAAEFLKDLADLMENHTDKLLF